MEKEKKGENLRKKNKFRCYSGPPCTCGFSNRKKSDAVCSFLAYFCAVLRFLDPLTPPSAWHCKSGQMVQTFSGIPVKARKRKYLERYYLTFFRKLSTGMNRSIWGAFHSTKITGSNFRNFRWSNGTRQTAFQDSLSRALQHRACWVTICCV